MNAIVNFWLNKLGTPTEQKIMDEIEEIKATINNEKMLELGYESDDPVNLHTENIKILTEYLEVLQEMISK